MPHWLQLRRTATDMEETSPRDLPVHTQLGARGGAMQADSQAALIGGRRADYEFLRGIDTVEPYEYWYRGTTDLSKYGT